MTDPTKTHRGLSTVIRNDFSSFLRKSFNELNSGAAFLDNWHLEAIAWRLEQVRRGEVRRLLITMPPRSLKSISVSVAFPAFLLGHDPTLQIITASYGEDLALKLARDCRALMRSRWYQRTFPQTRLSRDRKAEHDFETTKNGGRFSTTTGGSLTGRGGDVIIVDDPIKAADALSDAVRAKTNDWFRSTLLSRLNDKQNGAIIVVMQRLHVDDLASKLIEAGGWTHLDLPAIAPEREMIEIGERRFHERKAGEALHPEREPLEMLEQLRREMGPHDFSAQYLQRPVPAAGNLVRRDWLKFYDEAPPRDGPGQLIQSWDFAVSDADGADYSVAITAWVEGRDAWILDVFRDRIAYPAQKSKYVALAQKWRPNAILVENAANGAPLISDLRNLNAANVPKPIGIQPKGSKIERLNVQSSRIEAGELLLPRSAPWLDEFVNELLVFPKGPHDDQVDALSQLLAWAQNRAMHTGKPQGPILVGPNGVIPPSPPGSRPEPEHYIGFIPVRRSY